MRPLQTDLDPGVSAIFANPFHVSSEPPRHDQASFFGTDTNLMRGREHHVMFDSRRSDRQEHEVKS